MTDRAAAAVAQWARERPDLDCSPMLVMGRVSELAQLLTRQHMQPFCARHGLQAGEFDVLATLRRAGAPHALTPTALYETAMISSGGMTSRIDRLEKAGLVARQPHPDDRRATLVTLTPAGIALIDQILPEHVDNEHRLMAALDADEQAQLAGLLKKWIASLNSDAA